MVLCKKKCRTIFSQCFWVKKVVTKSPLNKFYIIFFIVNFNVTKYILFTSSSQNRQQVNNYYYYKLKTTLMHSNDTYWNQTKFHSVPKQTKNCNNNQNKFNYFKNSEFYCTMCTIFLDDVGNQINVKISTFKIFTLKMSTFKMSTFK